MAALLTHVSIREKRSTAAAARAWTWSHSATSVGTASARPPARSTSLAAASSAWRLRAARTTAAPRSPNATAVARPMPDDAPVMTTTWSAALVAINLGIGSGWSSYINNALPERAASLNGRDADVAIVGAGPAGAALAVMLGSAGLT